MNQATETTTDHPVYLRPDDLGARWGVKVKTLANWRCLGEGPTFVKLGASVRYALADVLAYEQAGRVEPIPV